MTQYNEKPHELRSYRLTMIACFTGIFTQAIVTNLTAVLFIPLKNIYGFSYGQLGILVGLNFVVQVGADLIFSGLIDKIGFTILTRCTCVLAFLGMGLYAATPLLFQGREFTGLLCATAVGAFSSGLLEVVLSPLVDAIPNEDKGPAMSLMHSFYAWGQALTIVVTTVLVLCLPANMWPVIVAIWAFVPLVALFLFCFSKIPPNSDAATRIRGGKLLRSPFFLVALGAILFGGATEICMNQWSSSFLNGGLGIPKIWGDLLGMCGFALMMGLGRTLYGVFGARLNLNRVLLMGSGLCVVCYLTAALSPWNALCIAACAVTGFFSALLWPGVIVLASARFPQAGAWMFAILAAAGDIGASVAPYLTGLVTDAATATLGAEMAIRMGILFSAIFALLAFFCHLALTRMRKNARCNAHERIGNHA